jgi:hypothetical protein
MGFSFMDVAVKALLVALRAKIHLEGFDGVTEKAAFTKLDGYVSFKTVHSRTTSLLMLLRTSKT